MRLDKYLKVSRLIKRRTVANEACDNGRVTVNGRVARASTEVKVGDTVTVIGRDGAEENTWDGWADQLGTISYELVCGVSKRVPRIYLRDGETVDTLQYIV